MKRTLGRLSATANPLLQVLVHMSTETGAIIEGVLVGDATGSGTSEPNAWAGSNNPIPDTGYKYRQQAQAANR
jgi:hypothetical protein